MPEGAVISHRQSTLFGYVDVAYPGDLMVPDDAVNSAGLPLHALTSVSVQEQADARPCGHINMVVYSALSHLRLHLLAYSVLFPHVVPRDLG